MKFKRRIAIATTALSFAAVGLAATPASSMPPPQIDPKAPDCSGILTIRGTNRNESFTIYPNRVEIRERGSSRQPRVVWRGPLRSIFVIDTGEGNDVISSAYSVDFIACLGSPKNFGGRDKVYKKGGDAVVHFGSNGTFSATGGSNHVTIDYRGTVTTGGGPDKIKIGVSARVSSGGGEDYVQAWDAIRIDTGPGDDTVVVEVGGTVNTGSGEDTIIMGTLDLIGWPDFINGGFVDRPYAVRINSGPGNDTIDVTHGQATINSGSGKDQITTGRFDDTINSGADPDYVNAGNGQDNCGTRSSDDTFINCETIKG